MNSKSRPDFTGTDYLEKGNAVQRRTYGILRETAIMDILAPYGPVVAGTIPLNIDIPGSDIDILCSCSDFDVLELLLVENFGTFDEFHFRRSEQCGVPVFTCSFLYGGVELEIFAQDRPVEEQNGYRHMLTEYELLRVHGRRLRDKVVELKLSGIKTEPAFAIVLGLAGDPYQAVLQKGRELGLF